MDCSEYLPQPGHEIGPVNSSLLKQGCFRRSAITDTSQVPEDQVEVLSQTADTVSPLQQHHRQLDAQTCALLVHEVLEPLATRGPSEQLLCQHAIQTLLCDSGAGNGSVNDTADLD